MASKRESKKLITEDISLAEAESLFAEYASADAQIAKINAAMDVKITAIRDRHSAELANLATAEEESFAKLQHFATAKPELFIGRKSLEMAHGKLGFRTGNPALKPLKGFTWASITNLVSTFLPDYLRTKVEPNKEALLDKREDPALADLFAKCGFAVEQSESFYVECKKEEQVAA